MIFQCLIIASWLFVHLESVYSTEVNVYCRVLRKDYCFIENPEKIILKPNENLNFIVEDANAIKKLEIVNDAKGVIGIRSIPNRIFATFPELNDLVINSNDIAFLECDCYQDAKKLTSLTIGNNEITTVPSRVFSRLTALSDLSLTFNHIKSIEDNAFDGMIHLSRLFLNRNAIQSLNRFTFAGGISIKELYLGWNNIETIEDGALNLPNLTLLFLEGNKLKFLPDTLFVGARNLEDANFAKNEIRFVGRSLLNCDALKSLTLNDNPVEDVNITALSQLQELDTLKLEKTKFNFPSVVDLYVANESKLKTIKLSWLGLYNPDILKHLSVFHNLEQIIAVGNNFSVVNGVEDIKTNFPKLTKINLDLNQQPLCSWIAENEQYFKNISVTARSPQHPWCVSADFADDDWSDEFDFD